MKTKRRAKNTKKPQRKMRDLAMKKAVRGGENRTTLSSHCGAMGLMQMPPVP
jgi:hypothetical protein